MNKRPLSITLIGWLFVVTGCGALAKGVWRYSHDAVRVAADARGHAALDLLLVAVSAALAIVGGAFVLRGRAWARWVCVAWLGLHVIVGLLHSLESALIHSALFVGITLVLFRPAASHYLRGPAAR